MTGAPAFYPITLDSAPATRQSRLTVFFRLILAIPHHVIVNFLQTAAQVVALIAWFAILFTGKCPAGLFSFMAGYLRWSTRVNAYMSLLTDVYPPFALEEVATYPVRIGIQPQLENRNRLTAFFRILLVIPHLIVLTLLGLATALVLLVAWFAALIMGRVPAGMHEFLLGVLRWSMRVNGYLYLLTDEYPPFSLS